MACLLLHVVACFMQQPYVAMLQHTDLSPPVNAPHAAKKPHKSNKYFFSLPCMTIISQLYVLFMHVPYPRGIKDLCSQSSKFLFSLTSPSLHPYTVMQPPICRDLPSFSPITIKCMGTPPVRRGPTWH